MRIKRRVASRRVLPLGRMNWKNQWQSIKDSLKDGEVTIIKLPKDLRRQN